MANALDLLLNKSLEKAMPTRELEIKRLSEALGEKFVVELKAVRMDDFKDIQEKSGKVTQNMDQIDPYEMQLWSVIYGMANPNLKSKELKDKFGFKNPKEAVNSLFLPGEIASMAEAIMDISGFGRDMVAEVKNS